MKKIGIFIIAIFPLFVYGQKNFEGSVIYKSDKHGINITTKYFFGKSRIKFEMELFYKDGIQTSQDLLGCIIDFKGGTEVQYSGREKKYSIEKLDEISDNNFGIIFEKADSITNCLGHLCHLYRFTNGIDTTLFNNSSEVYIGFPNDLKYIVPGKYKSKISLPANGDANILWLEKTEIYKYKHPHQDTKIIDTMITKAVTIDHNELPDSVFNVPKGFNLMSVEEMDKRQFNKKDTTTKTITITEITAEEAIPEPPPPPPPKPTKSSKRTTKKPGKQKSGNY